jgi:hypothetical protein
MNSCEASKCSPKDAIFITTLGATVHADIDWVQQFLDPQPRRRLGSGASSKLVKTKQSHHGRHEK